MRLPFTNAFVKYMWVTVLWIVVSFNSLNLCTAFANPTRTQTKASFLPNRFSPKRDKVVKNRPSPLLLSYNDNNDREDYKAYDLTKPTFDVYTLRGVRGDALAKYNSLNQSEPLRINLSLLAAFFSFSYPSIVSSSSSSLPMMQDSGGSATLSTFSGGEPMTTTALCIGAGLAFAANFVRECRRRNRQLTRLEKELQALELPIRMPAKSVLSDSMYESSTQTIRQLQGSRTLRVLALFGTKDSLKQALEQLFVLSRRLVQSETVVVPIPSDDSTPVDWGLDASTLRSRGQQPWLAAPGNAAEWKSYFSELSSTSTTSNDGSPESDDSTLGNFKWFGLSALGRSFGSGQGSIPSWIQLMGQHMRPTIVLDEDDSPLLSKSSASESSSENEINEKEGLVYDRLKQFYSALTEGDETAMCSGIFPNNSSDNASLSPPVTDIMNEGGRLDPWALCLKEGNRPSGMRVADADVVMFEDRAYSTVVEFPDVGMDVIDASLLAQQNWIKDGEGEWKLLQHQTIPWSNAARAGGTLVCDKRGCVSLVRGR